MEKNENVSVDNYNNGKVFKIDNNKAITESLARLSYITHTNGMIYATGYSKNIIHKIPENVISIQILGR